MTTYGYRVMELYATPPGKPRDRISFDQPVDVEGGLRTLVLKAARLALDTGKLDENRNKYIKFAEVRDDNWGILLTAKGGEWGESRELVDVYDDPDVESRPINPSDAVISDFHALFIVPPYGDTGLLVTEVKGRSHWTVETLAQINLKLDAHGIKLRLSWDLVDASAWNAYFSDETVGVKSVELVQKYPSSDRTRFTNENVKSARLEIDLLEGSEVKQRVIRVLNAMREGRRQAPRLAGVVGLTEFGDSDFDEERIVTVKDGKTRKINVTTSWPKFVYTLDATEHPTGPEFVNLVRGTVSDTLKLLNVDLASNWRPHFVN
ncbi:hypothetical protein [Nocardia transvalensis]|uniref:hypothetical protein n=1 Tax=Nocardia transvalensis TaxID=37333 RepID=UPI001895D0BF|nr:hypothetical protein [Nocardia transvalensis]MBF6332798.1 hypothetical protein [Nocardia transvalensis]